jgi:hypothetical protein
VVVTDVPVVSSRPGSGLGDGNRLAVRILLAGVSGGAMRAVNYARALEVEDTRVATFAFDADERRRFMRDWNAAGAPLPLDLDEAPYRDIGTPLLQYLRRLTADGATVVNVVIPEVVVRGWPRLLHNQRTLYIKRMLLFEPRVILTSVPYQLFR